jgi:hypothetical protein
MTLAIDGVQRSLFWRAEQRIQSMLWSATSRAELSAFGALGL